MRLGLKWTVAAEWCGAGGERGATRLPLTLKLDDRELGAALFAFAAMFERWIAIVARA